MDERIRFLKCVQRRGILSSLLLLVACSSFDPAPIDPSAQLTRDDYLALRDRAPKNTPSEARADAGAEPPIPDLPIDLVLPTPTDPLHSKRVSVSVSEQQPVRDVLQELAREAHINLELDPRITASIIFTARDQPLDDVLRRICKLAKLRMIRDDDYIRIVVDEPYQETYHLDYLSLARKSSSATSIATNVFDVDVTGDASSAGSASAGTKSSNENNSTSRITASSETDFWGEVERTLRQIMASSGGHSDQDKDNGASVSLDKQAGLITVFGTAPQQEAVGHYIKKLKRKANAQVLIDARIVEVELNDTYTSGVNWRSLFDNSTNVAARFGVSAAGGPFTTATSATDGVFTASFRNGDFAGIINFVQGFGTTRVLSAPRLTVLNNQTAVLKVATNQVYFVTQAQFTTVTNANGSSVTTTPVYTSTPRTVPVGLVMTVQPAIDAEHDRVTMTLRPTISRVVDQVSDPSIGLNAAQAGVESPVDSKIPVLAVREMDSVIRLKSGEVAIMGGLMQDSATNQEDGLPHSDHLPIFGDLFKARSNDGRTTELVILLRATIADNPSPDEADGDVYSTYTKDPRPMAVPRSKTESGDKRDQKHKQGEGT